MVVQKSKKEKDRKLEWFIMVKRKKMKFQNGLLTKFKIAKFKKPEELKNKDIF